MAEMFFFQICGAEWNNEAHGTIAHWLTFATPHFYITPNETTKKICLMHKIYFN